MKTTRLIPVFPWRKPNLSHKGRDVVGGPYAGHHNEVIMGKLPTTVDALVIDKYLPVIGSTAFAVYIFYLSRADPKTGECCIPIRTTANHCSINPKTVERCNKILLYAGLIVVFKGNRHIPNIYKILNPATTLTKQSKALITRIRLGVRSTIRV